MYVHVFILHTCFEVGAAFSQCAWLNLAACHPSSEYKCMLFGSGLAGQNEQCSETGRYKSRLEQTHKSAAVDNTL